MCLIILGSSNATQWKYTFPPHYICTDLVCVIWWSCSEIKDKSEKKVKWKQFWDVAFQSFPFIFPYQALSLSLCVLTVSVFNTCVADKMARVPEKAKKCLLKCGEPASSGSLVSWWNAKSHKNNNFWVNIELRHSHWHGVTQWVRVQTDEIVVKTELHASALGVNQPVNLCWEINKHFVPCKCARAVTW